VLDAMTVGKTELRQALALLTASGVDEPEHLPVSSGDRRLLAVHREVVGRHLALTAVCSGCDTVNEIVLAPETIPAEGPRIAWLGGGGVRQPTYGDLLELPDEPDDAQRELLRRCIVGEPARAPAAEALDLVDDSLVGPLLIACAGCSEVVEVPVDVQQAVLESLRRFADSIELEVHLLARAYHWDLGTIEALPDERRERLAALVEEGR
jgi:hypothetical protein